MAILAVENLSISFEQYQRGLKRHTIDVMSNLSIELEAGEILAIVGASGSGKSLLAHAILGILPDNAKTSGTITYQGKEVTEDALLALRGKEIALIPQSVNFLDPLQQVGKQVRQSARGGRAVDKQRAIFKRYRLEDKVEKMYPFQLSGGMARRTLLSTAAVADAKVIIADEPTPGLDEVVMQEALQNFREFADENRAVMLITHDIQAALTIADKIAVFYAGTVVEIAPVADFAGDGARLRHPYTQALWRALPQNAFIPIPGAQPMLNALPSGCLFAPRCPLVTDACRGERPAMRALKGGKVRCIHAT